MENVPAKMTTTKDEARESAPSAPTRDSVLWEAINNARLDLEDIEGKLSSTDEKQVLIKMDIVALAGRLYGAQERVRHLAVNKIAEPETLNPPVTVGIDVGNDDQTIVSLRYDDYRKMYERIAGLEAQLKNEQANNLHVEKGQRIVCDGQRERIRKLEASLKFYGDAASWEMPDVDTITGFTGMSSKSQIEHDRGKIAREALDVSN
jgi:hypothetical protein